MKRKKLPIIGIDLGDTAFDRTKSRIEVGKTQAIQLCDGAFETIQYLSSRGHDFVVVSKIDLGQEARVSFSLFHSGLVPLFINPENVRFCYKRGDKGQILKELGAMIHVDDRIETLNSAHDSGIPHKILFTGVHDERKEDGSPQVEFEELMVATSWREVQEIIESLGLASYQ